MGVKIIHHETQEQVEALGYKGFHQVGGIIQFIADNGVEVLKTPFGGTTLAAFVPDKHGGKRINVVAGFKELEQYEEDQTYQGRIVLLSNRVRDYTAPGSEQQSVLIYNEKSRNCHLHGGPEGANQIWALHGIFPSDGIEPYVEFWLGQPDGYNGRDGGYGHPGPVSTRVIMKLSEDGTFTHKFIAGTNKTTFYNPTTHEYFTPAGVDSGKSVGEMAMYANWTHHIIVDKDLMPAGDKLEKIDKGSKFDFSTLRLIGESGLTLDDCFGRTDGNPINVVFYDPETGIGMMVTAGPKATSQCYMGGGLQGRPLGKNMAGCHEPGAAINGPNEPELCDKLKVDPYAHKGKHFERTILHRYFAMGMPVAPVPKG